MKTPHPNDGTQKCTAIRLPKPMFGNPARGGVPTNRIVEQPVSKQHGPQGVREEGDGKQGANKEGREREEEEDDRGRREEEREAAEEDKRTREKQDKKDRGRGLEKGARKRLEKQQLHEH